MTTGPNGEGRPESTFADVLNSFSFDSGRKSKRRLWGRRRDEPEQRRGQAQDFERKDDGYPDAGFDDPFASRDDGPHDDHDDESFAESVSTFVRPYTWTKGRTKSGFALEIETLVTTSPRGRDQIVLLQVEHRAIAELCQQARSVAEVAALLRVPLGVAKVLVGDMAGLGLVAVHQQVSANGSVPDLRLMERVLSGLRRL